MRSGQRSYKSWLSDITIPRKRAICRAILLVHAGKHVDHRVVHPESWPEDQEQCEEEAHAGHAQAARHPARGGHDGREGHSLQDEVVQPAHEALRDGRAVLRGGERHNGADAWKEAGTDGTARSSPLKW